MGKPFANEIKDIGKTIQYINKIDSSEFELHVQKTIRAPLYAIGSGGSLSACCFLEQLHQNCGSIAKVVTPLESFSLPKTLADSNVFFMSAGGKNKDILLSFDQI